MIRKARAGHVTGGRVFGYDNVPIVGTDGRRFHVERRVNDVEAVVVRTIFELCTQGHGVKTIAARLNDAGSPSPRPQQGRPKGWAPSSVREVLYRPLYRWEVVWNQTRKRDVWGVKRPMSRAVEEWVKVPAPELRIVSDDLWQAVHQRLEASRATYLQSNRGQVWGRPATGVASKYLLTGLARCGYCGGSFLVKTRSHGRRRAFRYGCSSYHLRGRSVCANGLDLHMADADAAVLNAIAEDVLVPGVVEEAFDLALTELTVPRHVEERRETLENALRGVQAESERLTMALATGGDLPTLVRALQTREQRRAALQQELAGLKSAAEVAHFDRQQLDAALRARLDDWRGLLGRQVSWTRQMVQKLLIGKIVFTPTLDDPSGERCYQMTARFSLGRFFSGIICPKGVASR